MNGLSDCSASLNCFTVSFEIVDLRFIGSSTISCGLVAESRFHHKTLSALIAELGLYGYVEVERKGRGRGRGVDFYIYPTDSVERKALLDALTDLVV